MKSVETFLINNFINTNHGKNRLYIETNTDILDDNGYIINNIETRKLMNRVSIGE